MLDCKRWTSLLSATKEGGIAHRGCLISTIALLFMDIVAHCRLVTYFILFRFDSRPFFGKVIPVQPSSWQQEKGSFSSLNIVFDSV